MTDVPRKRKLLSLLAAGQPEISAPSQDMTASHTHGPSPDVPAKTRAKTAREPQSVDAAGGFYREASVLQGGANLEQQTQHEVPAAQPVAPSAIVEAGLPGALEDSDVDVSESDVMMAVRAAISQFPAPALPQATAFALLTIVQVRPNRHLGVVGVRACVRACVQRWRCGQGSCNDASATRFAGYLGRTVQPGSR